MLQREEASGTRERDHKPARGATGDLSSGGEAARQERHRPRGDPPDPGGAEPTARVPRRVPAARRAHPLARAGRRGQLHAAAAALLGDLLLRAHHAH